MKTLRECLSEAEEKKVAIGHFNISNLETLWGIWEAAHEINVPVIIGVSEGERKFVGLKQARILIESLREEYGHPIFINADHSYSFETFKAATDVRYDSAIFDGTQKSIEENIAETKKCVEYARSVDPEILVEGELGYIGTSSKLLDELPPGVSLENQTTVEDAKRFVSETGVDLFAPAVGNVHGMLKNTPEPKLNIERIQEIREAIGVPLVLHGASGNSPEDLTKAIVAGIAMIHINTEIRFAWKRGALDSFNNNSEEIAPYKLMQKARAEVKRVALEKLKIFNNI